MSENAIVSKLRYRNTMLDRDAADEIERLIEAKRRFSKQADERAEEAVELRTELKASEDRVVHLVKVIEDLRAMLDKRRANTENLKP
jgi:hypothetical protein